jgi:N-acetylglucosaminyldiphosphoundecaprenol N-acetyl-beta-D-mannosaminyltransferase
VTLREGTPPGPLGGGVIHGAPLSTRLWPERRRVRVGKLEIDPVTFAEALEAITVLVSEAKGGSVFTPNVDHIVLTENDVHLQEAYAMTSLSLVDGMPVLWAARLLGVPLPEKVSGSDLVEPLVARAASNGWRVYLLGGAAGAARTAGEIWSRRYPSLSIVGAEGPRIDMSLPAATRREVAQRIETTRPHLVFVALGNPKQELWIHENRERLRPAVLVAVGAALDFAAGATSRAPRWMSRVGLEWLYRLGSEPRRLWRRYLLRDPKFLLILLRSWLERRHLPGATRGH